MLEYEVGVHCTTYYVIKLTGFWNKVWGPTQNTFEYVCQTQSGLPARAKCTLALSLRGHEETELYEAVNYLILLQVRREVLSCMQRDTTLETAFNSKLYKR